MLRSLKKRASRDALGLAFVEGAKLVNEAIAAGEKSRDGDFIRYLVASSAFAQTETFKKMSRGFAGFGGRVRVAVISDSLYRSVSDTDTPQGVMAVFSQFDPGVNSVFDGGSATDPARDSRVFRILVLDGVQDPGNVGVMTRSAAASGFTAVVLGVGSADFYSPKTLRATMGAAFRIPVARNAQTREVVAIAKSRGARVYAADARGAENLFEARLGGGCLAIVIGGEGSGVSAEVLELCDGALYIPMRNGVESLNAGAAAAVVMYEALRQYQYGGQK